MFGLSLFMTSVVEAGDFWDSSFDSGFLFKKRIQAESDGVNKLQLLLQ